MNPSDTAKALIKGIIILSAIGMAAGIAVCILIGANPLFYAIGLAIGVIMSVAKVIMLERAIGKVILLEEKNQARNSMRMAYMSRLMLTAVLLFVALFFFELTGLAGAAVGTLALTLSAYGIKLFSKEKENNS